MRPWRGWAGIAAADTWCVCSGPTHRYSSYFRLRLAHNHEFDSVCSGPPAPLRPPLARPRHARTRASRFHSSMIKTFIVCSLLLVQACNSNSRSSPRPAGGSDSSGQGGSISSGGSGGTSAADGQSFAKRLLVDSLSSPWEISWGPDGWLWVTERTGKRVVRIRPSDG